MFDKSSGIDEAAPAITLEQFCRALAIHAMLVGNPATFRDPLAPEIGEQYASFVYRFANGEKIRRPRADDIDHL
jgi:hypothetical protein